MWGRRVTGGVAETRTWNWIALLLILGSAGIAAGNEEPEIGGDRAPAAISKAELTNQLEEIQSNAKLDPAEKMQAVELIKAALDDWDAAREAEQRTLRLQRQLETATRELATLRTKLASLPAKSIPYFDAALDAEQLERQRDELERTLDQPEHGLRVRVERLEQELKDRPDRLQAVGQELLEVEEKRKSAETDLDELPDAAEKSPIAAAQRLALRTVIERWNEETAALEAEREWLEAADADRWIQVLRQIAEREAARTEEELQRVDELLEAQRRKEAAQRVEQARQEAQALPAGLQPWADENRRLAERSQQLTERLETVETETNRLTERHEALDEEASGIREMIEKVGRNNAIGMMLRQQSARLPDVKSLRRVLTDHEEEIREIKLKRFEIDQQERATPEAETLLRSLATAQNSAPADLADGQRKQQIDTLLAHRAKLLGQLDDDYKQLFDKLAALVLAERRLLTSAQDTAKYYREQMLWMRSGSVFGVRDAVQLGAVANWRGAEAAARELPGFFVVDLEQRPAVYLAAALAVWACLLFGGRRSQRAEASQEFSLAAAGSDAVSTALRAALVPGLLAFLAWRIDQFSSESAWLPGISNGLWRCAAWAWPLVILRRVCSARGLASVQLGWSSDAAGRIARRAAWFVPPSLALMFVVGATENAQSEILTDSLGRAAFLVLMVLTGWFCRSVFVVGWTASSAAGGVAGSEGFAEGPASMSPTGLAKTPPRPLFVRSLLWMIPLAPWALAAVAFAGYYDTALRLAWRLETTAWMGLILAGLHAACARWIASEQQRLERLPEADAPASSVELRSAAPRKSLFARLRDSQAARGPAPAQVGRQMLVLLRTALAVVGITGLTSIWTDVLPSAVALDRWTLWQTLAAHQVIEPGENGGSQVKTINRLDPVTVVDLGLALLICGVTFVAARNIPGLVEVLFLERLPLDVGGRFAVTILVRYALFVVGVSLACARINVGWSNVQWLVAAASVGLGFGLQDIFANFVSGIILLFERPIRVGDVITIGDTTGTVSQIRFRSTTILDADRRELVVPNKDLITGKLLNWTLSDRTNRIKIRVTVGYDADPNRVRQLLQEIALSHPTVLKEPPPTAALEEFGPTTLVFMLRAFLPSLDDRSKVIHELHSAIHTRLHADGIVTPAPAPAPAKPAPATSGFAA